MAAPLDGVSVNLFSSGSLVLGGPEGDLKGEILELVSELGGVDAQVTSRPIPPIEVHGTRIGTDEVGKGDYFGPLAIGGTLLTESQAEALRVLGVKDSKLLSDTSIQYKAQEIRQRLPKEQWDVIRISPLTYNSLHQRLGNVNGILGWGHAKLIENLLKGRESCTQAVADQFGDVSYINSKLKSRGRQIQLTQVVKGEREVSVAAASILARAAFIDDRRRMGEAFSTEFPKGSTHVIEFAREFVKKNGAGSLRNVAKLHFRTTLKVLAPADVMVPAEVADSLATEEEGRLHPDTDPEATRLECLSLILSFERDLRRFIAFELEREFGTNWWNKAIPPEIGERCVRLRAQEEARGKKVDLVDCLDFGHYRFILTERNNWPQVFERYFKDKGAMLARFQILQENRNPAAHSRGDPLAVDQMAVVSSIKYLRAHMPQKTLETFNEK
jgi:ribonuclease HIII